MLELALGMLGLVILGVAAWSSYLNHRETDSLDFSAHQAGLRARVRNARSMALLNLVGPSLFVLEFVKQYDSPQKDSAFWFLAVVACLCCVGFFSAARSWVRARADLAANDEQ